MRREIKKLRELMYKIFATVYRMAERLPIKEELVFSIMTHDSSENGNIKTLQRYMSINENYEFYNLDKEAKKKVLKLLFQAPIMMARSSIVLMDNAFMPMAFFKVRGETRVLQLWHGTGSLKKFAQDSNEGRVRELERQINSNIDYLFVNSSIQIGQYARAFAIDESKVFATGLPRTDFLINLMKSENREELIEEIKRRVSATIKVNLEEVRTVLYAPTFRDDEVENPKLHMNVEKLREKLPKNIVILLRLHPHISGNLHFCGESIIDVSKYSDLNEIMAVSDALITDYSSIFFDYIVFNRPIYFFADDIESFVEDGRGLYLDYGRELPGETFDDEGRLSAQIEKDLSAENEKYRKKRERFMDAYYSFKDGNSTKRIYELAICEPNTHSC